MNTVVAWSLALIFANYIVYSLTGYPPLWCSLLYAAQPLAYYAAIVNLCLAAAIVAGGLWQGPLGAIKASLLLFGFTLAPSVLEALIGFGYRCVEP